MIRNEKNKKFLKFIEAEQPMDSPLYHSFFVTLVTFSMWHMEEEFEFDYIKDRLERGKDESIKGFDKALEYLESLKEEN